MPVVLLTLMVYVNMSSCFYLRITFPNPHILLKAKTLRLCFKICHTLLFSASGSTYDNISSLSITKNMQSLIPWKCV